MKVEVLRPVTIVCEKGSIVEVSERQYELIRAYVKKVEDKKKKK